MTREFSPESQCRDKIRYLSRKAARTARNAVRGKADAPLHIYRCPHCGLYHLGKTGTHITGGGQDDL